MSEETMTFPQVLRAMANNMESGRGAGDGMEFRGVPAGEYITASERMPRMVLALAAEGRIRKAPSYIEVAGIQVPEPMREPPEEGVWYWYEDDRGVEVQAKWTGNFADRQRLQQGNVFESVSGPEARAKAERLLFGVDSTASNE